MKRILPLGPGLVVYLLSLFLSALTACGTVGEKQTFNTKIAAAYVTVQVVAEGAAAAQRAGNLTATDVFNIVTTSRVALAAIGVAQSLHANNAKAGEDKLAATVTILTALQGYLIAQGANNASTQRN